MSNYEKRRLKNNQICELIIEYLKENNNIVSKQTLVQNLINRASLSTIYRGINRLEKKGLIVSCDLASDRYIAFVSDNSNINLAFFVCNICKKKIWIELNDSKLNKVSKKIKEFYDFDSKLVLYEFYGICSNCISSLNLKKKKEEIINENSSYANR